MNQAQHIWLAIMTEVAIERCGQHSPALHACWLRHVWPADGDTFLNGEFWIERYGEL